MKKVVGLFIIVVTKSRIPVIYVTLGNPLHVPIWLMVQGCRHLRLLPQGGRGMSTNCAFFISEMFYCLVKQTLELLEDFFLDGSVRLEVVRAFHFFQCFFLFFVQGFRDIDADIHQ